MDLSHPANGLLGADLDTADKMFVVSYPLIKILVALVIAIYGACLTRGNDLFHLGVAMLKNLNHLFKPSGANILKKDDYLDSSFRGNVFSGKGTLLQNLQEVMS